MHSFPRRGTDHRAVAIGLLILAVACGACWTAHVPRSVAGDVPTRAGSPSPEVGRPAGLPLPTRVSLPAFEEQLFAFLNTRRYRELGWLRDKRVRDTGPYIGGKSYGTHPAVRVYYSPGVIRWLMGGRVGAISDGEMIIKEQYAAPAIRHRGKTEEELWGSLESWTVMVKDASGSHDGWFWSNPIKGQCVDDDSQPPPDHPVSGFGHYCLRCHAATQTPGVEAADRANEFTFASLRNIVGFPGEPILFRVDDSWRPDASKTAEAVKVTPVDTHPGCARPKALARPARKPDTLFLNVFATIKPTGPSDVVSLPPASEDWAVSSRDRDRQFLTSNQCMGCHSGLVAPYGPSMFLPAGKDIDYGAAGRDISPHGEWRRTPMGLAGRDPIFHAQVEGEIRRLRDDFSSDPDLAEELGATLADTCLKCHGAMGKRQFDHDHAGQEDKFSLDHLLSASGPDGHSGHGPSKDGALARDGVGCVVCHRMQPRPQPAGDARPYLQFFLETSVTGNFHLGPAGEIYGPFADKEIAPYAMQHATGLKPKHDPFLKSSQLCGTCHTISLPSVDLPLDAAGPGHGADELTRAEVVPAFRKFHHHVEQATYLEWLNSEYQDEFDAKNPKARSCADCHMASGLKDDRLGINVPRIGTRIAAIQDTSYPEAENLAPHDRLEIGFREEGYRRHNFAGLNAFLLVLFDQFDDILGVPRADFMTGSKEGTRHAIEDMARTARDDVASLALEASRDGRGRLTARVVVENKAGHRFPSGVGFRRAFLEMAVIEEPRPGSGVDRIVWASGRTNGLGMFLGADGAPLLSESFATDPRTGQQSYQSHHEVITSPDQVQVYETLMRDAKGRFTTSFVHGCKTEKDNRLLPRGWRREGPGAALSGRFLKATHPGLETAADPRYSDGSGSDEVTYRVDLPGDVDPSRLRVRATLYYQAVPPYYLRDLFAAAPEGPATRRLHHLFSNVDLVGTPIQGWKLKIASAITAVKRSP